MDRSCTIHRIDGEEILSAGIAQLADGVSVRGGIAGACPDLFPANVLSRQTGSSDANDGQQCAWWLAHTRPRQEKAVAWALYSVGVPYYLPLVTRKSLTRGRARMARIVLFPGYVFIRGSEEDRLLVLKTNRVLTVQRVPDGEQLRDDLYGFAMAIAKGAPLVREARLVTGERVRVKAGPFRETEGVVLRRNGKTRLMISVNYLQQGASLEVDDCMLEPV